MDEQEPEPDGWYVQSECRSGCVTQDHLSWGECVRAARIGTGKGETTKSTV